MGAMAPSSVITLTAPAGTNFGSTGSSYAVEDLTTATNCGYYNVVTSNSGATISLTEACGVIAAGDTVQVTVERGLQSADDLDR